MMQKWSKVGCKKTKQKELCYTRSKRVDLPVSDNIYTLDLEVTSLFNLDGTYQCFDYKRPPKDYEDIDKVSVPYIWMFGINEKVYYGRILTDIEQVFKDIYEEHCYKIIYIFNLSYEMQFLMNIFSGKYKIEQMCCRDIHKPIQFFVPELHLIFRCAYMLTNMSLEVAAKEYTDVQKKSGDLDYNIARSPLTYLTDTELGYCEFDIITLYKIILYFKNKYKHLYNIPLTSTSIVRTELKKEIDFWYIKHQWELVPPPNIYLKLMECFSGGYTHANILRTMHIYEDVTSQDEASAYPGSMVTEKFPVKPFIRCSVDQFFNKRRRNRNAFFVYVRLKKVHSKYYNHYMQLSKCSHVKNPVVDNGRVVTCDSCEMYLTDVDFDIMQANYDFEYEILKCYKAKKDYLDIRIIKYILDLYKSKTSLKVKAQTDDQIAEVYRSKKAQLNSLYGCSVSNPLNSSSDYIDGDWIRQEFSVEFIEDTLEKYKHSFSNLFYYAIGVWVTSYCRRNIFMILISSPEMDIDSIYSDTDSCKYLNNHDDVFDEYNKNLIKKYEEVCKKYPELTVDDFMPVDGNGIKRAIGAFELDGKYKQFVTSGAKKYAYIDQDDSLHITISGVNKKTGIKALKGDLRRFLDPDLSFNYEESGRMIHYYLDDQPIISFRDYKGATWRSYLKYGIVLQPTTYTMGLTEAYDLLIKYYERERAIANGKQKAKLCETVQDKS